MFSPSTAHAGKFNYQTHQDFISNQNCSTIEGNYLQNNNPTGLRQATIKRLRLETALEQMWRLDTEHFNNPHVTLTEDWKKDEHESAIIETRTEVWQSSYRKQRQGHLFLYFLLSRETRFMCGEYFLQTPVMVFVKVTMHISTWTASIYSSPATWGIVWRPTHFSEAPLFSCVLISREVKGALKKNGRLQEHSKCHVS